MNNIFKIYPRKPISGILPNNKQIIVPTILPLNASEFIRCMNNGEVYAIVDGKEVLIKEINYDKALKVCNTLPLVDIKEKDYIPNEELNSEDDIVDISIVTVQPSNSEKVEEAKEEEIIKINSKQQPQHNNKNNQRNKYQSSSNQNKSSNKSRH